MFRKLKVLSKALTALPKFNNVKNFGEKPQKDCITRFHNRYRYDEYRSLSENKIMQKAILAQERQFFESLKQDYQPHVDKYLSVSSKRTDSRNAELPELYDDYYYFSKFAFINDKEYEVFYRRHRNSNQEEVLLDLKEIPFVTRKYWPTASLAKLSISDDHQYVAFCVDLMNDENYVMGIKNIRQNVFLKDRIYNVSNMKFSLDGKSLLYLSYNEKRRSNKLFLRTLNNKDDSSEDKDVLLFEEKEENFYLDLNISKDKKYFILTSSSKEISEIRVKNRLESNDKTSLIKIVDKKMKSKAYCNHANSNFYLLMDSSEVYDFKVVSFPDHELNSKNRTFQDYYLPEAGARITEIDIFQSYLVLYLQKYGSSLVRIIHLENKSTEEVSLDTVPGGLAATITPGLNENFITDTFRFHLDTPFIYNRIYEYHIPNKKLSLLEDFKLLGKHFNSKEFQIEKLMIPSEDGEEIPLTLIHKKKLIKNGKNKLLLHGYGAYGIPMEIGFNVVYLSVLEDDWILAFAHVRGGNEKGFDWHRAAKKLKKVNSFKDFIDCAEYLVATGYTNPALMCAYGSSAGGLLIGAAINIRPQLFKAVVLNVPFLDVLTELCDPKLPLTISDYDEFGNPQEDPLIYDLIASYSPYENLRNEEYPFVFISCGSKDFRIPLWTCLKYMKRFRDRAQEPQRLKDIGRKNIILSVSDAGHYGDTGVTKGVEERALYVGMMDWVVMKLGNDLKIIE